LKESVPAGIFGKNENWWELLGRREREKERERERVEGVCYMAPI
jgi:hypothetical protein